MSEHHARTLRDGTITIKDGNGNSLEIVGEEGNLNWTEPSPIVQIKDRGSLSGLRKGEEEPVSLSFSVFYKYLFSSSGERMSPYEAFKFQGKASDWVSTTTGDVKTLTLEFKVANPEDDGEDETIIFHRVPKPEISFEESAEGSTLSFDGIAYVTCPVVERNSTKHNTTTTTTTTSL